MAQEVEKSSTFFKTVYDGSVDLDTERFLTEVDAMFQSEEILDEVRWRLDVLHEIAELPELKEASAGLRDRLTQIFTEGGEEKEVLGRLHELIQVPGADGKPIDLRRFVKRAKRVLAKDEYRKILHKKLENTKMQAMNLLAFYPEQEENIVQLTDKLGQLTKEIRDSGITVETLKTHEDHVRATASFTTYEQLKRDFLGDWLKRFAGVSEAELQGMSPEEIQGMIAEHSRHQMTELLKAEVSFNETDMTEHLGLHDTLEASFANKDFWERATSIVKRSYNQWILGVVMAFGMVRGKRYAFFQSEKDSNQYMLFGLALTHFPSSAEQPMTMVPYMKPFTRKAGYLLEVRNRDVGGSEEYHRELVHYLLPFLYAFDQMDDFKVHSELVSFFNSAYQS